jgi:hypothetical protein
MSDKRMFSLVPAILLALLVTDATAADRAAGPIQGAQTKAILSPLIIQRESTLSPWEILVRRMEGTNLQLQCNWQRGQFVPATRDFRIMCGEVAAAVSLIVSIRGGGLMLDCPPIRTPSVSKGAPVVMIVEKRTIGASAPPMQVASCRWSP